MSHTEIHLCCYSEYIHICFVNHSGPMRAINLRLGECQQHHYSKLGHWIEKLVFPDWKNILDSCYIGFLQQAWTWLLSKKVLYIIPDFWISFIAPSSEEHTAVAQVSSRQSKVLIIYFIHKKWKFCIFCGYVVLLLTFCLLGVQFKDRKEGCSTCVNCINFVGILLKF